MDQDLAFFLGGGVVDHDLSVVCNSLHLDTPRCDSDGGEVVAVCNAASNL